MTKKSEACFSVERVAKMMRFFFVESKKHRANHKFMWG